jgi:protein-disulfide isomerase
MSEQNQATFIFGIGFFSLLLLIIIGLFFSELVTPSTENVSQESATDLSELTQVTSGGDPLVSVVPGAGSQGTPRMIASDPSRGSDTPTVTIMEFGDFQCEECAQMGPIIAEVVDTYPEHVRHVWKDFPIRSEHAQAEDAAVAARCAKQQGKFWVYHDFLLENQTSFPLAPWADIAASAGVDPDVFGPCFANRTDSYLVEQSFAVARNLGLTTAPTYYINERRIEGSIGINELKSIVEEEIEAAGKSISNEEE